MKYLIVSMFLLCSCASVNYTNSQYSISDYKKLIFIGGFRFDDKEISLTDVVFSKEKNEEEIHASVILNNIYYFFDQDLANFTLKYIEVEQNGIKKKLVGNFSVSIHSEYFNKSISEFRSVLFACPKIEHISKNIDSTFYNFTIADDSYEDNFSYAQLIKKDIHNIKLIKYEKLLLSAIY